MIRQSNGFTLVEVCLAIAVMAVSVLSMCGLYTLGYRENRQSVEDVAAVAYADAYLAPLVQGLSATNMTWSKWCEIGRNASSEMRGHGVADGVVPEAGWMAYVQEIDGGADYRVKGSPRRTADGAFDKVIKQVESPYNGGQQQDSIIPGEYEYGLVVTRRGAVIQLAFRASRRKEALLTQPVIVAEVHFQGDPNK